MDNMINSKNKFIEVYPCGTKIQFKDIDVIGQVTGITLRGINSTVMYEISYFLNNQYQSHWLYENQLNFEEVEKVKIGFRDILDKNDPDWQIKYCEKEITNMPEWKKEIYKQNFSDNSYWSKSKEDIKGDIK